MKPLILAALLALSVAWPAVAAEAPEAPPATGIAVTYVSETPEQRAAVAKHRAVLEGKSVPIQLDEATFSEALKAIAESAGVDLTINWPSLELVGIDQDSLVRYSVKQATPAEHLTAILASVSADAFDNDKAGHAVTPAGVTVSTLREINAQTTIRLYNIGALLREPFRPVGMFYSDDAFAETITFHAWLRGERAYPMTDAFMLDIYKQHLAQMMTEVDRLDPDNVVAPKEDEPDHGGLFGKDDDENLFGPGEVQEFIHPAIDELIELIHEMSTDYEQWLDEEGMIEVKDDQLIIRTTRSTHREIEALLNALLDAEVQKQADTFKDAHASRLVARANKALEAGDDEAAQQHIDRALRIMPNHVPAQAMQRLLDAMDP